MLNLVGYRGRQRSPKSVSAIYALVVMSSVLISATFYFLGIRPLSDLLHEYLAVQITHNLDDATHTVGAVFVRHRELAAQIASRSAVRDRQMDFLQGRVSVPELKAFAGPKLADALRSSTDVVAVSRYAPNGRLLVSVGEHVPEGGAANCLSGSLTEVRALPMQATPLRFIYCSPIYDQHHGLVGFDVILYATQAVQKSLDSLNRPMMSFALASSATDIAFRQSSLVHEAALAALQLFLSTGRLQPGYAIESVASGIPGLTLYGVVEEKGFYAQIQDNLSTLLMTLAVVVSIILVAAVILLQPVVRLILDEQHLIEMATCDSLTGLLNRWAFHSALDREMDRARRYRRPLSIILCDVDYFKRVNDTYGHPVGDEVLHETGLICAQVFRRTDICARYGGEEFAVILPETREPYAEALANRLRLSMSGVPIHTSAGPVELTLSAGVLTWDPARCDAIKADLIRQVDAALYASKAAGRNRVTAVTFTT